MRILRDTSISRKLTLIGLVTSVTVLLLACATLVIYEQFAFRRTMTRDLSVTAQMIGFNSAAALSFNDVSSGEQTLKGLAAQQHIVAACVYDLRGQVFATYRRNGSTASAWPGPMNDNERFGRGSLEVFRRINLAGETIGSIYLESDLDEIAARWKRYAIVVTAVMVVATLGAVLIGSKLQRLITEPISRLVVVASEVASQKDYSMRATKAGNDELGRLIDGFNNMLSQIQTRDAELRKTQDELEQRVLARTNQLQTEMTERSRVAEALQVSEAFLNSLLENLPVNIYRKDTEGRFIFANKRFCEQLNKTPAEILGKTDADFFPAELVAKYRNDELVVINTRRLFETTDLEIKPNGEQQWIQSLKVAVLDNEDRVVGTQGIQWDVTARKQAEEALKTAKEAAEAAVRAKSEFLANMSHEIRTPMNGVIGMTRLLLDTKLDPTQREYAETACTTADTLLTIINDILDFSKIEAGKLVFEAVKFNLVETLESACSMMAERAKSKGLELTVSIAADTPAHLCGDPGRLRQVLVNLLGNAIKFTEHGKVVVRVARDRETDTQIGVRFSVKDTGIGIPLEEQRRLFKAFSQADTSTTRKYGGTGLGLAIAKQLVALMQGEIGIQSEPGKGSTFWFTAQFQKQSGEPKPAEQTDRGLLRLRVLVVGDDAPDRAVLSHEISASKRYKAEATNGSEALVTLRSAAHAGAPYHLVLVDREMIGTDGLALALAIKTEPGLAATRLIILSAPGKESRHEELNTVEIDACLDKPVKSARLFDCLANIVASLESVTTRTKTVSSTKPADIPLRPLPKMRILLAEDNRVNQKVAIGLLRKIGCAADVVSNGLEVMTALHRSPYDIIFMDWQMPDVDGIEATRAIRLCERDEPARCPWKSPLYIIAMTANAMQGDREKCITAGMNDYISKPVQLPDLLAALGRWKPTA